MRSPEQEPIAGNPAASFLKDVKARMESMYREILDASHSAGTREEHYQQGKLKRRQRAQFLIELPASLTLIIETIPEKDRDQLRRIADYLAKEAQKALDKANQDEGFEGELENLYVGRNGRILDLQIQSFES